MKEKLKKLSLVKKATILASLITIGAFLICIPFFFFNLHEIPLGILLGGVGCIISLSLFTIKEKSLDNHTLMIVTIINIVMMSVIHILVLLLAGLLYYLADIHLFNLYATFGASFIGLISLIIVALLTRRE